MPRGRPGEGNSDLGHEISFPGSEPGTSGYSRHGSAYEKSLPRSLFAANLFSPRRSRRKFDVSSWLDGRRGEDTFSFEVALFVSNLDL